MRVDLPVSVPEREHMKTFFQHDLKLALVTEQAVTWFSENSVYLFSGPRERLRMSTLLHLSISVLLISEKLHALGTRKLL